MLKLEDFRLMSFERKCDLITFRSNYLCYRVDGDHKYFLYDAGGFFVEVVYAQRERKVSGFNAFNQARWLDPYLERISLADLSV